MYCSSMILLGKSISQHFYNDDEVWSMDELYVLEGVVADAGRSNMSNYNTNH